MKDIGGIQIKIEVDTTDLDRAEEQVDRILIKLQALNNKNFKRYAEYDSN